MIDIWVPKKPRIRRKVGGLRRRRFLGGAAAAIGLPFLESLAPKTAKGQDAAAVRLGYFFVPNGLDMATFRPSATGTGYSMPPMLEAFEPRRSSLSVITRLSNLPGIPDGNGDHASGTAAVLTCASANKSQTDIRLGISADQLAANAFGQLTRLPSIQLGADGGGNSGDCDNGYGCAYSRNISWANETTPLPKIVDPAQVFDSIFQGFDPDATDAEQEARRALETSVLDVALEDAELLHPRLGATDRVKLDQYLEGIRELERRVGTVTSGTSCTMRDRPGSTLPLDQLIPTMMDMIVLSWQCDVTRIASFMYGNSSSKLTFPWLDSYDAHHDISHHAGDQNKIAQLARIGKWELEQIAYLMGRLDQIVDGPNGESLLYNSAIYVSSDVSDGDIHNHDDMPVLLAGNAAGALNPGSHIAYPTDGSQKTSNLLVTMLAAAGVDASLGDSDGSGSLLSDV